ncbi:hypothetical protein QVD17_38253 [Tagetes erecta]|uniref:Uncharacterized protein n=1 Tax=Tagetes erecta TaxID=13708 RepID=A0AAD8NKR3_TARER|nr:hypothetical protein QVD17_38253 [Tagetes erecta]
MGPEEVGNEETLSEDELQQTKDDVDVDVDDDSEMVYDDCAEKYNYDNVDWKNEIDKDLEHIIEYYKQAEEELVEVSGSGNHLLIRAVSQYSLPHQDNEQNTMDGVDGDQTAETSVDEDHEQNTMDGVDGDQTAETGVNEVYPI